MVGFLVKWSKCCSLIASSSSSARGFNLDADNRMVRASRTYIKPSDCIYAHLLIKG